MCVWGEWRCEVCVCGRGGRSEVCVCGDPECIGVGNDSRGLPSSPPLLLLTRDVPIFSH